jgi:hypothetical protein
MGPAHHHVDPTASALAAHKPRGPIWDRHLSAVPLGHLGGVGLDLMAAILAPNDQPDLGGGSVAERHQPSGIGFHLGLVGVTPVLFTQSGYRWSDAPRSR